MPAQVRQLRRRRSGGGTQNCSTMLRGPDVDATNKAPRNSSNEKSNANRVPRRRRTIANKTGFRSNKRLSKHQRLCRLDLPELPDDIVLEILLRLPVKSLLRFKCVCKTWRATVSSQSFIQMHLQRSVSNQRLESCFLITPHLLDEVSNELLWPNTFSTNICFYGWQHEGCQESVSLVYARDFKREFGSVYRFVHCDGLVLLPTDNKMYVLNPATRDILTLPESPRWMLDSSKVCRATVGFGRDPCTNKYKVVQCFRHSEDNGLGNYSTGMEVLTVDSSISSASWRDALPPYPVSNGRTAVFFKGSLIWMLRKLRHWEPPETRLLRFCLQAETFSFTVHPPCPALDHQNFAISELDGEFCLAQYESSHQVGIWMTDDVVNPRWDRRYVLNVEPCVTMAISYGGLLVKKVDHTISKYSFQNKKMEAVASLEALEYHGPGTRAMEYKGENLFFFQMIPYAESLVPAANEG